MKQFHIAAMWRGVMRYISPSASLSYRDVVLGVLQTERGGNRAPSSTLCASFDLVAFGTCPYQPTRIQLHTQSHKHASKITKYHLLLSFNSLFPFHSLTRSLARTLAGSFLLAYLSSIHSLMQLARTRTPPSPNGDVTGTSTEPYDHIRRDGNKADTRASWSCSLTFDHTTPPIWFC